MTSLNPVGKLAAALTPSNRDDLKGSVTQDLSSGLVQRMISDNVSLPARTPTARQKELLFTQVQNGETLHLESLGLENTVTVPLSLKLTDKENALLNTIFKTWSLTQNRSLWDIWSLDLFVQRDEEE